MSIISFGNTTYTEFHQPRITVIDYDFDAIGQSMANLWLRQKGYIHDTTIQTQFDAQLILRDSVETLV